MTKLSAKKRILAIGDRYSYTTPSASLHTCELPFFPPYDWETVLGFFRAHQLPYLEMVDDSGYERVVPMRRGLGWFRVEMRADRGVLSLSVWNGTEEDVSEISASVRNMFDLDANPDVIARAMKGDRVLASIWARNPGLRLARSWSSSESMFGAVLGQVVSVKFGRVLLRELMRAAGSDAEHPKTSQPISLFPSAKQILEADLSSVRTSETRRVTLRLLAQAIHGGAFDHDTRDRGKELRETLRSVPGVGTWTTEYIAMRGFRDDDAFPATDYALKQELKRHPEMNINSIRPWRGYAAVALWKRFADSKRVSTEVVL